MKIGFVFTNYNNSKLSIQAARSIADSARDCDFDIVIVDNASKEQERTILAEPGILPSSCFVLWSETNTGYFGGLNLGIDQLKKRNGDLDAVVIGNNDLVFDYAFFDHMKNRAKDFDKFSVICPSIVTLDNVYQNPHVVDGISRVREIVWDIYFSNFMLSRLIAYLAKLSGSIFARKDHRAHNVERFIYSGYGACYILTPKFFESYQRLWSPGFLMGEEFYLTRQLQANGEKMYYIPDIVVRHHDHATVSELPDIKLWKLTRQFHRIYRFFINPYQLNMDNGKIPDEFDQISENKS